MSNITHIGETIRELRKVKGYTQEELGRKIKCSKGNISKIENGKISPTLETLNAIAKALGKNLSYILRDTLEDKDYQLTTVKSLIERFVRITTVNEYFDTNSGAVLNPGEFIYSLLADTANPLILQMDENLIEFARNIAEAERLKKAKALEEKEYDDRILSAIYKLNKSLPSQEVASYCLISIQDVERIIEEAVRKEVAGLQAIGGTFDDGTTTNIKLRKPDSSIKTDTKRELDYVMNFHEHLPFLESEGTD